MLKKTHKSADLYCMNCPKCGFQQGNGPECLRCGLIFSRFHAIHPVALKKNPGSLRSISSCALRFYRVFRWITLAVLIVIIALILRTSKPPPIAIPPDSARIAEEKVQRFQTATGRGSAYRLELDQAELNGWLSENLALKKGGQVSPQTQQSVIELAKTATNGHSLNSNTVQQSQSSVRDVKITLNDDRIHVYAVFDLYGKDMSLELEGRLLVQEGYLQMDPTGGKFGSLPLFSGTLRRVAERLFTSPENKEKFKLPHYIHDVRVENGFLIVDSEAQNASSAL